MHVATMLLGVGGHQLNVAHAAAVFAVAAVACLFGFVGRAGAATTERVSVASDETQSDGAASSNNPIISRDGRYVLFLSSATNLVAGDTNGVDDVFVRDTQSGTTERVSVAGDGSEADGDSGNSVISADGRFVAFISDADNLVPGDTNDQSDLFLRDRVAGTTQRVSVSSTGDQSDGDVRNPFFSDDGRRVVFASQASTIVAGDGNAAEDVFVRDRVARTTQRVSVAPGGVESDGGSDTPAISADGAIVTFDSRRR